MILASSRGLHTIFLKFILAFIVTAFVPLLFFSTVSLETFADRVQGYALGNYQQLLAMTAEDIQRTIERYDGISRLMYTFRPDDYLSLSTTYRGGKGADAQAEFREAQTRNVTNDMVLSILSADRFIENVFFVDYLHELRYVTRETRALKLGYDFLSWKPYRTTIAAGKALTVLPTHAADLLEGSDDPTVTLGRNFMDISTASSVDRQVIGTLLFDVGIGAFEASIDRIQTGRGGGAYLMTEGGLCVTANDGSPLAEPLAWFQGTARAMLSSPVAGVVDDGATLTIFRRIPAAAWIVAARVSKRDMLTGIGEIRRFVFTLVAATAAALLVVAFFFSRAFSRPVRRLLQKMKRVEAGDLTVRADYASRDELGELAAGFDAMVGELKRHIDSEYVSRVRQREAELAALRAQIRPHALYNTLEVIRMSAAEDGAGRVADMVYALSRQLQYLTDPSGDFVPLRMETECIADYFALVRLRYEDRFRLEVDVASAYLEQRVPKLTIQPLVENAVAHGLRPRDGPGTVRIEARHADGALEVVVTDDGVGMTPELLTRVQEVLTGTAANGPDQRLGIGLRNVHERIAYFYGKRYGVSLESQAGLGTTATLRFPWTGG